MKVAGWGANLFLLGGVQPQLKAVDLRTVEPRDDEALAKAIRAAIDALAGPARA